MFLRLHYCVVLLLAILHLSTELPLKEFYPFGINTTDDSLAPTDDDASRIQLSATFPFFGIGYNILFINNNGLLSFGTAVSTYTPRSFPLSDGFKLIAPYWADVDTRKSGTVWFRQTNDTATLSRISREITDTGSYFQPKSAVFVTWDRVGYFSAHSDLTNTFQCVLASDGSLSFVIFLYSDGGIQWTTGDNSGGNYGVGGTPALVGVNAGDGVRSMSVSDSQTAAIINIPFTSNIEKSGVWIFQVNYAISESPTFCRHEEIFSGGITYIWPETSIGTSATFLCINNPTFSVSRNCDFGGFWEDFERKGCGVLAGQLDALLMTTLTIDTLGDFLAEFSVIIAQSKESPVDQTVDNLKLIADIFGNVAKFIIENNVPISDGGIGTNVVLTVDSLVQWTPTAIEATSGSRLIESFEDVASLSIQQIPRNTSQIINFTSLTLVSEKFDLEDLQEGGRDFGISGGKHFALSSQDETDQFQTFNQTDFEASIHLPSSLFENISDSDSIGLFFTFYDTPTLFPVGKCDFDLNDIPKKVKVATPVIASTVGGNNFTFENLTEAVEVSFRVNEDFIVSDSEKCVSWDFELQDWTQRGCTTTVTQDGVILCSCNHLTNFAVLVDICLREQDCKPSKVETALTYISYIGMTTSIVSLVFTLIVLLSHKRIRQKMISKYHIQLSLSLLLMLVVSMVLVVLSAQNITALYGGCVTVSVLVHYFTLVAVMWMGAEALFMFQKLVLVFIEITTKYIIIVSIICWGFPIILVTIPLLIDLTNGNEPENDIVMHRGDPVSYCFLSHIGAFWGAFLAPIILILIFNLITFVWIAVVLILHARRTSARKIDSAMNHKSAMQLMISIGGVMFLFGITWLFAILTFSVPGLRETFQILFTLFNSFQGFFIFLFFCAISKEARDSWKELLGSIQQSEFMRTPTDVLEGKTTSRSHMNSLKNHRSRTDTSTVKLNDHNNMIFKSDESRKDSWSSVISGCKSETLSENSKMLTEECGHIDLQIYDKVEDSVRDKQDEVQQTTESAIEQIHSVSAEEEDSATKPLKDNSSLASSVIDTVSESVCSTESAKPSRKTSKDSASLRVRIRRYSSRNEGTYEIEMEVEEMAVEIHSESSNDSSDEETELNNE